MENWAKIIAQSAAILAALAGGSAGTLWTIDPGGAQDRTDIAIETQQLRIIELVADNARLQEKTDRQEWIIRRLLEQGAVVPDEE